ncbi:helix-turn-helix transcriptional regulator [Streptoalloteichus tenebrarius]|uniref:helix-turn-helix transcriptional regulator n=1 Tax=Streptoalloteichus tenebrarius (strain ATCC 17920 / DSM 40477 / JCM 4838 / CBS 697.72 / NBRC 16177 / NCIMB 11028 / NRRL B-12390 / A12253. 1 / ISP 5477) TaxID=1933 RepID=UPI0020A3468B|nr:helix-turn-helix transcriptional regulator [Streptoalloteichus tenebrarius]BFF04678.1 helix-turn-helix transcriptional regulator [Streptoalloteichus tenebrarius]
MTVTGQLGEFLRARRARLRPEDVGLGALPGRRRVTGLRREELAQLAGVSVSYYTRLEQGQSVNASDAVLDALAGALRLDDHERTHLRELASRRPRPLRRPPAERVNAMTLDLVRSMENVPTLVLGRRTDVLAWNPLGHALLASHLDPTAPERPADRPNVARMLFLDPHCRDLYVDWDRKARGVVANLRLIAGRHPEDALLASLVGELSVKSPEFVALWGDHRVKPCEGATYRLRHPLVGELTVTQQALSLPHSPEQSVLVVTAEQGSSSQDTLRLLGRFTVTS